MSHTAKSSNFKRIFSFEIFPPRQTTSFCGVSAVIDALCDMSPDFISVTFGAGGSAKDNRTAELCSMIKQNGKSEPVAHLTCIGSTKSDVDALLDRLEEIGVHRILALRGDRNPNVKADGDFAHASDLISYIKAKRGNKFDILAACYPAGHSESATQKDDIINLKRKVDAGVSGLITQMFFDNEEFYRFRDLAEVAGIDVPIEAGIMPITNSRQIERTISLSGATMPARLTKLISRYGHDDAAMFDAGTAYAVSQIAELLSADTDGIHLYTMNSARVADRINKSVRGLFDFE